MKATKKIGLLFFSAIALTILLTPLARQSLAHWLNRETLSSIFTPAKDTLLPVRSIGLFLTAHIIANAIGIPGTVFVIVGGAVYGLWWGTLWSVIGATLGAIAAFWLARYLLHDWFTARFKHNAYVQHISRALYQKGLSCVLAIRFSPVSPFNLVNFALGLTPVSMRAYSVGTFIGIIPGTLIYTWLGVTGAEAISGGKLLPLFCCLLLLAIISAIPLIVSRRQLTS